VDIGGREECGKLQIVAEDEQQPAEIKKMYSLLCTQLLALADLKFLNNEFPVAVQFLQKRIQLEPKLLDVLHELELFQFFANSNDLFEALQLTKNTEQNIVSQFYLRKAIINLIDRDEIDALGNLRKSIRVNKTDIPSLLLRSELLRKKKSVDKSAKYLNRVLGNLPSMDSQYSTFLKPKVLYTMATVYKTKTDFSTALKVLGECLSLEPHLKAALHLRGKLLHNEGLLEDALRDYATLLELDPTDYVAKSAKGSILVLKGDLEHAKEEMKEAIMLRQRKD